MAHRQRARAGLATAAVALLTVLTACSSGGGNSRSASTQSASTQSGQPAGVASSSPQQSLSDLAAAAAKEGSLTWYVTYPADQITGIIKAFNEKYPDVKVNPLRLSADKIPPRVITEEAGGKYNADLVEGDSAHIFQLKAAGDLQPYTPPDAAPLPGGLDLPDGYRNVDAIQTTVIAYNPTVLKQAGLTAPTSWEDLTKPAWKGHFSIDPGAVNWYESLVTSMGHDKALQLLQSLGKNAPRLVESHTQALTQVQSGEPVATATAYGWLASTFHQKTPDTVAFVNLVPLPTAIDVIDIVKNAPHPNAAELFMDWLLSKSGQQALVQVTNHTSLRTDVSNDPAVWDPAKWAPAWADPNLPAATYNTYLKEMTSALKAA